MTDAYVEVNGIRIGKIIPNDNRDLFTMSLMDAAASCPTIRLEEIRTRRFDVGARSGQAGPVEYIGTVPIRHDIMIEEDNQIFDLIRECFYPEEFCGYWIEPENQKRVDCLFCGGELTRISKIGVVDPSYLVCKECDRR